MEILAPIKGKIAPLKELKDGVFSEGMMGDGFTIEPEDNIVYAPIKGKLETVFNTGHAFGIVGKDGTKILIHVGIDTVQLGGKGFNVFVKQGKKIKAGKPLVEVDFESIKDKVKSIKVIVLVLPDSEKKLGEIDFTKVDVENQQLIAETN
ncbi:MAG: PTS glucose transporter subunit IIA [Mycoplasma sp.]|nr:PTS glucose transporter subunit IIA [Mycoplasma sp.]